ncbi:unnamed protein product, partial [Prorocentrum cordatum]
RPSRLRRRRAGTPSPQNQGRGCRTFGPPILEPVPSSAEKAEHGAMAGMYTRVDSEVRESKIYISDLIKCIARGRELRGGYYRERARVLGRTVDGAPQQPGVLTMGRLNRLELIDPTADAFIAGDANLTFAELLAKHREGLGHVGRVVATTFESIEICRERYKEIDTTIKTIEDLNGEVLHDVDCTRLAVDPRFKGMTGKFGAVYYNFPHAGVVGGFFDGHPFVRWRHENLMHLFFSALRVFVKPGGVVKVASNANATGVRFSDIMMAAEMNEFTHVETVPFLEWQLRGYLRSYGDRRDANRRPGDGENYRSQRAHSDMVSRLPALGTG